LAAAPDARSDAAAAAAPSVASSAAARASDLCGKRPLSEEYYFSKRSRSLKTRSFRLVLGPVIISARDLVV